MSQHSQALELRFSIGHRWNYFEFIRARRVIAMVACTLIMPN